eukprot:TRINITY_DN7522_c0_g1_i10.p1 TRINITY_DN7522_c0_g1~~TRINITY_DN7522_c0_g1_i10.p1  ORF type:complete len:460 (+),score=123.95 TRINITY_DN7522_c0_g1_i10:816-2195(+)
MTHFFHQTSVTNGHTSPSPSLSNSFGSMGLVSPRNYVNSLHSVGQSLAPSVAHSLGSHLMVSLPSLAPPVSHLSLIGGGVGIVGARGDVGTSSSGVDVVNGSCRADIGTSSSGGGGFRGGSGSSFGLVYGTSGGTPLQLQPTRGHPNGTPIVDHLENKLSNQLTNYPLVNQPQVVANQRINPSTGQPMNLQPSNQQSTNQQLINQKMTCPMTNKHTNQLTNYHPTNHSTTRVTVGVGSQQTRGSCTGTLLGSVVPSSVSREEDPKLLSTDCWRQFEQTPVQANMSQRIPQPQPQSLQLQPRQQLLQSSAQNKTREQYQMTKRRRFQEMDGLLHGELVGGGGGGGGVGREDYEEAILKRIILEEKARQDRILMPPPSLEIGKELKKKKDTSIVASGPFKLVAYEGEDEDEKEKPISASVEQSSKDRFPFWASPKKEEVTKKKKHNSQNSYSGFYRGGSYK